MRNKIREGRIPSDQPRPPIRGISFPQNDQRPGLPTPGREIPVTHQVPQATTSADTGAKLSPDTMWTKPGSSMSSIAATGSSGSSTVRDQSGPAPAPSIGSKGPSNVKDRR